PTPGGAGAGEWGFAALYLLFHAAEATGVLASLVQRLLSWVIGLGGYVIYLCLSPSAAPAAAPVQPAPFALAAGSTSARAGWPPRRTITRPPLRVRWTVFVRPAVSREGRSHALRVLRPGVRVPPGARSPLVAVARHGPGAPALRGAPRPAPRPAGGGPRRA